MKCIQNSCAVRDDQQSTFLILLIFLYTLGNKTNCIDIQTRVCLIQNCQARLEHHQLKNLSLLFLTTGESYIQTSFCIRLVHLKNAHILLQFLLECPQLELSALLLTNCISDESFQRKTRNLERLLERKKHTLFRTLISALFRHIVSLKID